MDKTIHIFRGFLNLRIYNRVFTSKYSASNKESGEKDATSSETTQKSAAQNNNVSENGINLEEAKLRDEIKLSSKNEVTSSDQSADTTNYVSADEKAGPVESETKSNLSSSEEFPGANEKSLGSKLERIIQISEVHSSSDSNLKDELQSYKEKFDTKNEGTQKSELGVSDSNHSFASLLRRSAFIELGDPKNKLVVGEIYNAVENDLYIEFGWKFPAICPRPKVNPEVYNIGAKVLLRIKDLELTARFLGEKEYTSLLEADCDIIYRINEDGSKFMDIKQERKISDN